jgi:hypothetical protein
LGLFRSKILRKIICAFFAVSICFGANFTAFASDTASETTLVTSATTTAQAEEVLRIDDVKLTGDILHITVTDKNTGGTQTLDLNLSDYAQSTDEIVYVQAVDAEGNKSNVISFKNPYYSAAETVTDISGNALTPDGTGEVLDNATEQDGKEFFSITTDEGNIFYLIVDRARNSENVYLLDAVDENDLQALAVTEAPPAETTAVTTTAAEPEPELAPAKTEKSGIGKIGIFLIVGILVGGIAYYIKIVRPKQQGNDDSDNFDDEEDIFNDNDYEYNETWESE